MIIEYGIGNIGWSSTAVHCIRIREDTESYAICKPNTGRHYTIGGVTNIKETTPSASNITCKDCLKKLGRIRSYLNV